MPGLHATLRKVRLTMGEDTVYTLVPSSNPGRYALDDPEGRDITSGQPLALLLGGTWIEGRVEHSNYPTSKYPDESGLYSITSSKGLQIGYYFIASNGTVCGLCAGMRVRLR